MSAGAMLFSSNSARDMLDGRLKEALAEVATLEASDFAASDVSALEKLIKQRYALSAPVVHWDRATLQPIRESVHRREDYGRMIEVKTFQTTIVVSVEGFLEALTWQLNSFSSCHPEGHLDTRASTLSFTIEQAASGDEGSRAHVLRAEFDSRKKNLDQYLQWLADDFARFQAQLEQQIRPAIEKRKTVVGAKTHLQSALQLPVTERANSIRSLMAPPVPKAVGITPRLPAAQQQSHSPTSWVLSDKDFQEILSVMGRMAMVIERCPNVFQSLKEEDIRTHFLIFLNGIFISGATGETFNGSGHTDIQVVKDNASVFIAECKVWTGPEDFQKAIAQLYGYATWRDAKLALVVFSKNQSTSGVIKKARGCIKAHPSYRKTLDESAEATSHYTVAHPSDNGKVATLALMVFDVTAKGSMVSRQA